MSFTEVIAEIPRLTREQRREVLRCVLDSDIEQAPAAGGFHSRRVDGRLVLTAPRVIRQAEVEAILEEFP
jgi:hypothetical protein